MAIPIRLLAGPENEIQTNLIVQSLDMQVDRGVSAFPTPAYMLKRFAIDTNTPRVTLELNGIVIDDEGVDNSYSATGSISSSPMKTLINFGNMLPNEPFSEFIPVDLENGLIVGASGSVQSQLLHQRRVAKTTEVSIPN